LAKGERGPSNGLIKQGSCFTSRDGARQVKEIEELEARLVGILSNQAAAKTAGKQAVQVQFGLVEREPVNITHAQRNREQNLAATRRNISRDALHLDFPAIPRVARLGNDLRLDSKPGIAS